MADTADNRQFSVMVDKDGVLNYPQNFITANSLAKFGSDVDGTLNSLTTTRINSTVNAMGNTTEYINFTPSDDQNTGIISFFVDDSTGGSREILKLSTGGASLKCNHGSVTIDADEEISLSGHSVSLSGGSVSLWSGDSVSLSGDSVSLSGDSVSLVSQQEDGNGSVEIGLSYTYFDPNAVCDITVNNNVLINKDKIAVSAPLVELPANTTIGGATPATFGSNVDGTLKSLTTTNVNGTVGVTGYTSEYIEFTPMDEHYNGSAISFYTHDGASAPQKRFEINAALARLNIPYGSIELVSTDGISLESGNISLNSGNIELESSAGISLNSNGTVKVSSQQEDGNGSVEIGLSYSYYDEIGLNDITVNNNVLINKDKITVSAPLVELPENTTIGGKTIASLAGTPSNMVTTDTEQTITGKKTFTNISLPDTLPVYDLVQDVRFYDGDLTTSSIHLGYNYSEINAKNEGLIFNCTQVTFYDSTGNNSLMTVGADKVSFYVPQYLRVFNTVTKTWTNTYKYTYLAQDANGNVTLAISDTHPTA